jgi:cell wall-associated NlpC family hydrolase
MGIDDSALLSSVAATQKHLDADTYVVHQAQAAADQASQLERAAQSQEAAARAQSEDMASAVRDAVVQLYMTGPQPLQISPHAGQLALYAADYAESTLGPLGVLAQRKSLEQERAQSLSTATRDARLAALYEAKAAKALTDEQGQMTKLRSELASMSAASAAAVTSDHTILASEAGKELVNAGALQFTPKQPLPKPLATTSVALTWAFAELGKEYVWGATGPDTFDCSGLTQFVWRAAGVSIPRVAADQYAWTIPVPLSQLLPGDLVFFGTTDIHHVGIYIGDGLMINAPHTGTVVQVSSIWWSDLAGFGRVHYSGTPIPPHNTPTPSKPATAVVVPTAGPVPAQTKPPAGWKPHPGATTPIRLGPPESSGPTSTTSTTSTTTTVPPPDPTTTSLPSDTTTTSPTTDPSVTGASTGSVPAS